VRGCSLQVVPSRCKRSKRTRSFARTSGVRRSTFLGRTMAARFGAMSAAAALRGECCNVAIFRISTRFASRIDDVGLGSCVSRVSLDCPTQHIMIHEHASLHTTLLITSSPCWPLGQHWPCASSWSRVQPDRHLTDARVHLIHCTPLLPLATAVSGTRSPPHGFAICAPFGVSTPSQSLLRVSCERPSDRTLCPWVPIRSGVAAVKVLLCSPTRNHVVV
jgi:hypothetical protein